MPAHRGPPPRGAEVGLGGDRVLVVAEVVADVGEQLDERDAEVGGAALAPVRHRHGEAVEDQPAEAGVVLGEVVEVRRRQLRLGRHVVVGRAVEVRRAVDLERERHLRRARDRSPPAGRGDRGERHEPQRVGREVAGGWSVRSTIAVVRRRDDRCRPRTPVIRAPPSIAKLPAAEQRCVAGTPPGCPGSGCRKWTVSSRWSAADDLEEVDAVEERRAAGVAPRARTRSRRRVVGARRTAWPSAAHSTVVVACCCVRLTDVGDLHGERGVDGVDLDRRAPSIRSPRYCCSAPCTRNCSGGGELRAVRREDELLQAAAEVGPVDPLARAGEQQLLDQVADVVVVGRSAAVRRRSSTWNGKSMFTGAVTRVCVVHDRQPACRSARTPPGCRAAAAAGRSTCTRVAPVTHCAVTHGAGAPPAANGQPATTYGAAIVTVGCR